MPTRTRLFTLLLLSAAALPACKSKASDPKPTQGVPSSGSSVASPGSGSVAAKVAAGTAVAPVAAQAPAGMHAAVAAGTDDPLSVPAVPEPQGPEKKKGPGETFTVRFADPVSSPHKSVQSCPGDKLVVVVPALAGTWSVVKTDAALGTPAEDVIKGWLGPGTDGAQFTWTISAATDAVIVLEEQQTHLKVAVDVAAFGCD